MATITASMFAALDGVVDPGVGNWHFPYFNEEMGQAVDRTHDADVMLFGRVTYDSFAGAWPERETAGEEDAPFFFGRGTYVERLVEAYLAERTNGETFQSFAKRKSDGELVAIGTGAAVAVTV